MKYDFDYLGTKELFDDCLKTCWEFKSGSYLEDCYLPEFKESSLAEAERLNVLLPLIKWEVDNNDLSEAMSDEFYLYYEDLLKGSVTDNIGTVGEILLRYAGSVKKARTGLYIVTEAAENGSLRHY